MKQEQLNEILRLHALWLNGDPNGKRANLRYANLRYANLSGANLSCANLSYANLSCADLSYANLSCAYLSGANLRDANLRDANLSRAYLSYANLSGANLSAANLSGAKLGGANLSGAKLPRFQLPQTKAIRGFKKLKDGVICELRIPAKAKRTASLVGNKCRAEYAVVLSGAGVSSHDGRTRYAVGETVRPDSYDDDIRVECTNGIHFFRTREEAERY
jgi:hypothetical protein